MRSVPVLSSALLLPPLPLPLLLLRLLLLLLLGTHSTSSALSQLRLLLQEMDFGRMPLMALKMALDSAARAGRRRASAAATAAPSAGAPAAAPAAAPPPRAARGQVESSSTFTPSAPPSSVWKRRVA